MLHNKSSTNDCDKAEEVLNVMLKKYIKRYSISYLLGILTLFFVDFISLYIPQFTGEITDGLKEGSMDFSGVLRISGLILLTGAGMALGRFGWRYFIFGSSRKIEYEIRGDMFEHLSTLSMGYYNEHKTGDLMAHFTNDLNAVRMAIGPAVITAFDAIIMTVMVIFKMIVYVDFRLTMLALVPMLIILGGGIWYGTAVEKRFREKQEAFSDLTDQVQESISGIRVIKAFVQERKEIAAFAKTNQKNKDKNLKVVKLQAVVMPLMDVIIGISSVIALIYGGNLVIQGKITTGRFVSFNQYIGMLVWPMLACGESITFFSQGAASLRRIEAIFREQPEIRDEDMVDTSIQKLNGKISFKHLTFRFAPSLPPVLKDVSVEIEKGSTLAILGKTGCGKTSIANLLLRLYQAEPGMIRLDGRDIKEIPLHVLREQIAYVPQDNFLFSDTIQANIAFGVRELLELPQEKPNYLLFPSRKNQIEEFLEQDAVRRSNQIDKAYQDLDTVQDAAKLSCVHENIMEFPNQYATLVGERGVTVSGGQKQRISIARALMKDAPILILDDALSAVDTSTEEQILKNLKQIRQGKTTIMIAHRISTIQNADHILVLEQGECAEYGTHEQLLKANGIYAKMYEQQQLEQQLEAV